MNLGERRVSLKMPMGQQDPETGHHKIVFAEYEGVETIVTPMERERNKTARLLLVKGKKGKDFKFRLSGNGQYEMVNVESGRLAARGTMMDSVVPVINYL